MKRLVFIISVLLLLGGCYHNKSVDEQLSYVDELISSDSISEAMAQLNSMSNLVVNIKRSQRMRYYLLRTKAENKADTVFTSDSLQQIMVDYYDGRDANDAMVAHYLLGRAYQDMGEVPMAIKCFYNAINCADTTAANCDYKTLIGIYGQMSAIFHQQNLPQDEINSIKKFTHYIKSSGDSLNYLIYLRQLVKPYILLGEKDSALHIIDAVNKRLEQMGKYQEAAQGLGTAIYIYTERAQYNKANQLLKKYEKNSNLFDEKGDIIRGREGYYWIKGFYELGINQKDSAEYYFRKAIQTNNFEAKSNGYKGMLLVYQRKQNIDSIVKYSHLNEAALDTLHNHMQIETIHQASSLYNYTRNQQLAEQEAQKKQKALILFWILLIIFAVVSVVAIRFYRKQKHERQEKIDQLSKTLSVTRTELQMVQNELKQLKEQDYETLIIEKEKRENILTQRIIELEKEINSPKKVIENHLDIFKSSQIVELFGKKALFTRDHPIPNKSEWNALVREFKKDMPVAYQAFNKDKKLSRLELYTCILLMLDYEESVIVGLTETSSQAVSTAKRRANQKLFNEKSAITLKYNIERTDCYN